ncbi:MAG: hypothetical protein ACJ74U_04590 [Jatrophihabitantaceae bacterium]
MASHVRLAWVAPLTGGRVARLLASAMGDAVIAAVVAGIVSVLVTIGKITWDARQAKEKQRLAARDRLDMYRAPLLAAVDDLGRRLNNIRNDGFLAYFNVDDRRSAALLSTLFRFAQYLGWLEVIYGYADRLRFESDEATSAVTEMLGDVGWILAADEFDRTHEDDFTTSQLMLWREEQRAIGELMRQSDHEPRCIGYNSFVDSYESRFSRWFTNFASQLETASKGNRLAELHRVLAKLICELDADRLLVEFDESGEEITKPQWAQPSKLAKPTKHTNPRYSA